MVSNAEGQQNGLKTNSVSEASNPGSRAEGDAAKNKGPKSPNNNNNNGPPSQSREHEQYLPIANVVRIMRKALPPHAKVGDEAKEMVQECVSEFISFLTSEANATCQQEHRKTVTAEDLIGAMSRLGFEHYVAPLIMYLQKYRENEMLPMITRSSGSHGSNIGPPPGFMYHPHYAMFGSAGNGVYYQDPSGLSNGIGNIGQETIAAATATATATAAATAATADTATATATAAGGYDPGSGPGMMGVYSADDGGAGLSWSPQPETGFYDPYGKYE